MKYDITIDNYIGYGYSAADEVIRQLENFEGMPCTVYLSSFGGYVTDGLRIYQAFKDHGNVTVYMFGMVASAATILAMGATHIKMSKNALLLIHRASLYQDIWGSLNSDGIEEIIAQLKNDQNTLDKLDDIIAAIYAEHAEGDPKTFAEEMKKEEWLTATEAKDFGLVDEILEEGEATAMTDDLRKRMVACGYPMPHLQPSTERNQQTSFVEKLRNGLISLGLMAAIPDEQSTENNATAAVEETSKIKLTMNTTFKTIMSCLNVESLQQTEDGSITLNAEQMQSIESALAQAKEEAATANATIAEKDTKISELNEQVENLMKGDDGDPDGGIPAPATDHADANIIAEMSDLLKYC